MRSPVNWALLGLVIQRSSYGYELVQRFERMYGDSLELSSPSQIYTALDSLQRRCLIERIAPEQEGELVRQPKPHYRATERGVRAYRQWLIAQCQRERLRSRMFARQLALLPPGEALAVLDHYERLCLEQARAVRTGREDAEEGVRASLSERLALEDDRLTLDGRLAWIQYARLQFTGGLPARGTHSRGADTPPQAPER
jgi:DNA-binding PadR family transcriptional regulator